MRTQLALIKYITQLGARINKRYNVIPDIQVRFALAVKNDIHGACDITCNKKLMRIEITLPWSQPYNTATIDSITPLLIHEYAHYLWEINRTPEERSESVKKYASDDTYRRNDEYRTWKRTKRMAKELGLWNAAVKNACLAYKYTWVVASKKSV